MSLVQYSVSMHVNGDCNWMPEVCTGPGYPVNVHVTLVNVIVLMQRRGGMCRLAMFDISAAFVDAR